MDNKKQKYFRFLAYRILKNINKSAKFRKTLSRMYLKSYLYVLDEVEKENIDDATTQNKDIFWTMWLQEERPQIVQLCLNTISKYCNNLNIVTLKNYKDFVDIPEYIINKYTNGKMKACFFSDYIRVCLLEKYGGTWIDGTCYMTSAIPKYILESDFFILQNFDRTALSNFFIHSKPHNYIIRVLKKFLEEYWKDNNKECYYFFFHMFLVLAKKYNKHFNEEWSKIPMGFNLNTKLMRLILFDKYDSNLFDWLSRTSYLHKLTYKVLDGNNPEEYDKNSLLNHLYEINL